MLYLAKPLSIRSSFNSLNVALFLTLAATASSFATTIAQWNFDGSVQTAASVDANVTATTFAPSTGANSFVTGNPNTGQAITATGWNVADGVKYWGFTVTANGGLVLDLSSLAFDDQRSGTGPTSWTVTINGITALSSQATHNGAFGGDSVSLTGVSFQNLSAADVRIFGFGASGSGGTWRLDNVTLGGTVDRASTAPAVPDSLPPIFDAIALAGVLLLYVGKARLAPVRVRA